MFSSQYFAQFGSTLWYEARQGLNEISWPDKRFFAQHGWTVLLHGFLSLVVIIAVYRSRRVLNESDRWRFLAARPLSAGFFVGIMATLLFYEYGRISDIWELATTIIAGISFARLCGCLIETSWKRQFVYGLIIVLILTGLMYVVSLPLPLVRLYIVLTALLGLFFCVRWARESVRLKDSGFYTWSLRLGALFLAVIMMTEMWGKVRLALYLFVISHRFDRNGVCLHVVYVHDVRGTGMAIPHFSSPAGSGVE